MIYDSIKRPANESVYSRGRSYIFLVIKGRGRGGLSIKQSITVVNDRFPSTFSSFSQNLGTRINLNKTQYSAVLSIKALITSLLKTLR